MSFLKKNSITIKVRYLGKLKILDNQAALSEVIGDNPKVLPPNTIPSQDITTTARILDYFGKRCNLDVYMHMCRRYYVRHNLVDNLLSIQDVCCQISEIKQEQKYRNGKLV